MDDSTHATWKHQTCAAHPSLLALFGPTARDVRQERGSEWVHVLFWEGHEDGEMG